MLGISRAMMLTVVGEGARHVDAVAAAEAGDERPLAGELGILGQTRAALRYAHQHCRLLALTRSLPRPAAPLHADSTNET
jgi:hypothetical protein